MTLPLSPSKLSEQTGLPLATCQAILRKVGKKEGKTWIAWPLRCIKTKERTT